MAAPSPSAAAPATTSNQKPTSAVINIIFAVQFPLQSSPNLSTSAKAGIGVGATIAGFAIFTLTGLLIWRTRKQKRAKRRLAATPQSTEPDANSNALGQSGTTAVSSSYAYPKRTELQTDGGPQSQMQTLGVFVPTNQDGYFPQQAQHSQYYEQQPMQQIPQMQQGAPHGYYGQQQAQGQSRAVSHSLQQHRGLDDISTAN